MSLLLVGSYWIQSFAFMESVSNDLDLVESNYSFPRSCWMQILTFEILLNVNICFDAVASVD